jgi:hypothetical protein
MSHGHAYAQDECCPGRRGVTLVGRWCSHPILNSYYLYTKNFLDNKKSNAGPEDDETPILQKIPT